MVSCTIPSLDAANIGIDPEVQVAGITDGAVLMCRSTLDVQANGWGMGGTDFGNTAHVLRQPAQRSWRRALPMRH